MFDKSSIIKPGAEIGQNVSVGPFSIIGKNVKLGQNCKIHSHVVIDGHTEIKENTEVYPFSVIGSNPQDLKFKGERTFIVIGSNNKIREYVTINPGTKGGGGITKIGNNCLLMVGTHIAHDCKVGSNVIFANNATLAGHVEIQDFSVIGGLSAIHQFVRIGEGAMIGGMTGVISDVIPYGSVMGNRAKLNGLNLIGLKRSKIDKEEIKILRDFYKNIFESKDKNLRDRLANFSEVNIKYKTIKKIIRFLHENSTRSICMPE
tara:strand:- start:1193 stop:1975 length:783 start_codon:yes stop_codon:yes gene_type:complete